MNLTINVNDVASYPSVNPIAAGGTTISINGSSSSGVNTSTVAVTDNTTAQIIVTKNGFNTYSTTINVFDYNMTIEIFLVPTITNNSDPDYQRVYPTLFTYYEPCSLNVHAVQTSSSPVSQTKYYANGNEVATFNQRSNFVFNLSNPGDFTFGIREVSDFFPYLETFLLWSDVLFQNTNQDLTSQGLTTLAISTALNNDDASNFTVEEYRPSLSLSKVQEPACAEDDCCSVSIGSEITITPSLSLNLTGFTSCANSTLTYELQDWEGNVLETTTYNIVNANPVDPDTLKYVFTPSVIGDHKVVATLENCCTSCTSELIIKVCDYIKLKFSSCNNYLVSNCSLSETIKYTLLDTTSLVIVAETTVGPGTSSTFVTPKDGMYILNVKDGSDELIGNYVVAAYCSILECLTARIQEILCVDCNCNENCKDYCKDRYELNRILPLVALFFNYVNKEYSLNRIYGVLDNAKITELTDVNSVISKILSFCSSCTADINDIGNLGTNNTNDCGCN